MPPSPFRVTFWGGCSVSVVALAALSLASPFFSSSLNRIPRVFNPNLITEFWSGLVEFPDAMILGKMDVNDFSYEDEMDAPIVGALFACVGILEKLVDNSDELSESIPMIPSSTRNEIRRKYVQSVSSVDNATSIKMIHMNRRTFYQLYTVVQRMNL
ncbi:hypothetical protein Taro_012099 [Colocasia esculenta]|uniref:Uncharacterized protein n=1 Tax=Colocasia esculenta TaxID=4460 RepID=A0A843UBZ6_COLES|nr:hypothetical protein [Colocasia esculenta]